MDITQTFYDNLASQYDKLFLDWQTTTHEQAVILERIFAEKGFDRAASVLDCACGIGTQSISLAALGYDITGSDISEAELAQAKERAARQGVNLPLARADFRALENTFDRQFDILIAMDNALPHMLTAEDLSAAIGSMVLLKNIKGTLPLRPAGTEKLPVAVFGMGQLYTACCCL